MNAQQDGNGNFEPIIPWPANNVAPSTGSSGGGVTFGSGAPTSTPDSTAALYIQIDSDPAGQLWEYYSGAWH